MAKKGMAQQALVCSFNGVDNRGFCHVDRGPFHPAVTWRAFAYNLHSVEMVIIMLFGITLIAVIAAKDTLKGLNRRFLGL
jgi:putative tricarboxylic transport membrane protein